MNDHLMPPQEMFEDSPVCPDCGGWGKRDDISGVCPRCNGNGFVDEEEYNKFDNDEEYYKQIKSK